MSRLTQMFENCFQFAGFCIWFWNFDFARFFCLYPLDLSSKEIKKHWKFKIVLHENVLEKIVKLDSLDTSFQRHKWPNTMHTSFDTILGPIFLLFHMVWFVSFKVLGRETTFSLVEFLQQPLRNFHFKVFRATRGTKWITPCERA